MVNFWILTYKIMAWWNILSLVFLIYPSLSTVIEDDLELICTDTICDDYECSETEECEYGLIPDVCQCCFECAKGPGERCGGMFYLAGTCMNGYYCEPHPKYPQLAGICTKKSN